MSTRLTTSHRERITGAMIRHRFEAEFKDLIEERAAFAQAVYEDVYKPKDRKLMASLPKGWLKTPLAIGVRFGGDRHSYESLAFSGYVHVRWLQAARPSRAVEMPVAYKHANGCAKAYEATHALAKRYEKLDQKTRNFMERVNEAQQQIEAALASVSTTKKLVETWPEAEPFCAAIEGKPVSLPAVPVDHLNKMLDLPVADAA